MIRRLCYLIVILELWSPQCLLSQQNNGQWEATIHSTGLTASIRSETIRCLASIVYTLSKNYGLPLTYEDPPLLYRGDLIDVTSANYQSKSPGDRMYLPRGGPLAFTYPIDITGHIYDIHAILGDLLDAYKASGYPGTFKLEEANGVFNIVPESVLDRSGRWVLVDPIMQTNISFPAQAKRTNKEVLTLLIGVLSAKAGSKIVLGTNLSNIFEEALFEEAVADMPAATLLERMSTRTGGHRLWLLLYEPNFRYYVLSIYTAL